MEPLIKDILNKGQKSPKISSLSFITIGGRKGGTFFRFYIAPPPPHFYTKLMVRPPRPPPPHLIYFLRLRLLIHFRPPKRTTSLKAGPKGVLYLVSTRSILKYPLRTSSLWPTMYTVSLTCNVTHMHAILNLNQQYNTQQ